jgi:Tol biopolymer transport system component
MPIRVGSLDGESTIVGAGSNAIYAEGHLLFLREGVLMAQPFDDDRLVTTGEAVPLAEEIQTVLGSGRVGVFSASENGLLLYRQGAGSRRQLTWFDRTGKAVGTVGESDEDLEGYPELSPDGRRVAVDRTVQRNGDVWLIDLLRGGMTRFTFDAAVDQRPIWSLDGTQVVFNSNRKGTEAADRDLYMKPSGGAGAEQLLLESPNPKIPYGWSPDGQILLYREDDPKTGSDLWALPMQGRKPVAVANSPFSESNGQFSPDGRWVTYQSNESGRYEVYVVPFPAGSGKWQISTGGGIWPRWRHDGKELFFIGPDSQTMAATITASGTSFEAAPPVPLFETLIVTGNLLGKHNTRFRQTGVS